VTPDDLLRQLYDFTLVGNAPEVLDLTRKGLELGLGPETLLYEALIPSLEEVGARFERGDFFVPEMLIAGKAMAGALEILRPLLAETGAQTIGKIVMGTVKGDVHDIGKNLVNIMFEGAGFEVIDLGVQVAPEKFLDAIREHQPDIVGFSAFLTTTMPMFKANINALEKAGMRDQVIVMVGGAPVTQEYADVVGADGYASDASAAVVRAKELIQRRRAVAPGRAGAWKPPCCWGRGSCVSAARTRSASSASASTLLGGRSSRSSCDAATCPGSRSTSPSRSRVAR
jgi:methylmalonyl-CoA mutase cobalamin-binding domain/chain